MEVENGGDTKELDNILPTCTCVLTLGGGAICGFDDSKGEITCQYSSSTCLKLSTWMS